MMRLTRDQKNILVEKIQEFFYQEHGEELGNLAGENLLEFIYREIGPYIYNIGISDAKALVQDRMLNIDEDLSSLERPLK
ncbi:uncharacterized protein (DUF2164 family) [Peribacillus deserti]|uniref:Uncharacterized protein (DUF2164 family) n=1 Tax=Peribacillus deserti TaxID=673318 RepID=A0ABS2QL18_9BACI|nr:DUF2164 domain-containing protein [Peribacillus deserti]MBM7693655.1 uncharacterized protein (DUF2164 family) [Peribacillus deserti]